MKLTFETHDYPNPKYKWCVVKLDGLEIGRCEMDQDGRLVPQGGRKPRPIEDIGMTMVRNMLKDARERKSKALADEARAEMLLRGLKAAAKRKTPNVEFSGVPAGQSSNHPAGGTSAATQG